MFNRNPEVDTINRIDSILEDLDGQRGGLRSQGTWQQREKLSRQAVGLRTWRERLAFYQELPAKYELTRELLGLFETAMGESAGAPEAST